MAVWNPWRGCHRYSEGCKFCYIHKGDMKRGMDTNLIVKSAKFNAPVAVDKKGRYIMKSGQLVYCCFSTDFLLEEADPWRNECWSMMKERPDLHFLFLTKRIERFSQCLPDDWGEGYENVTVGCTVENQQTADERLEIFSKLPIKHKNIALQPMLEAVDIEKYLENVELVVVGGEYDRNARPLDYDWALAVREQCIRHQVSFSFRQCGTNFIQNGKLRRLNYGMLFKCARESNIDYQAGRE
ncbi:DUF5131 family protein [Desulfitobacterium hafniense]|uniref:Phage protein Gp37/Gp68 n=3 Tax=Desulfitobacterium hafniense TaxID=49338 RepID=Q24ZJ9_DESHY|nr:DUF5131 family protein [Desulfitobacterium hafniense]KTE89146.1 hypothetical protein AT727_14065 [Desulfitobacterium hafniense]BAE82543.1 hypothetical protein DSY0754 [Desulfitobacterium hafniense Y51]